MNIKDNMREFRKSLGMRQSDLAQELGVSVMTIQRYESGAAIPSIERINQLAEVLGVTETELMYGRIPSQTFISQNGVPTTVIGLPDDFWKKKELPESPVDPTIMKGITDDLAKLNTTGQQVAAERVKELTEIKRYTD